MSGMGRLGWVSIIAWILAFGVLILMHIIGVGTYGLANLYINRLPQSQRSVASSSFYGLNKNYHGGILSYSLSTRSTGINYWGINGFESIDLSNDIRYFHSNGCANSTEIINGRESVVRAVDKKELASLTDWQKEVRAGDYITVFFDSNGRANTIWSLKTSSTKVINPHFWLIITDGKCRYEE